MSARRGKGKPGTPMSAIDFSKMHQRDVGRFLPGVVQAQREATIEKLYEERKALCRAAIEQACFAKREVLARKMYLHEAFTSEDWPTLEPLTPGERTAVIKEIRSIFGTPEKKRQARA